MLCRLWPRINASSIGLTSLFKTSNAAACLLAGVALSTAASAQSDKIRQQLDAISATYEVLHHDLPPKVKPGVNIREHPPYIVSSVVVIGSWAITTAMNLDKGPDPILPDGARILLHRTGKEWNVVNYSTETIGWGAKYHVPHALWRRWDMDGGEIHVSPDVWKSWRQDPPSTDEPVYSPAKGWLVSPEATDSGRFVYDCAREYDPDYPKVVVQRQMEYVKRQRKKWMFGSYRKWTDLKPGDILFFDDSNHTSIFGGLQYLPVPANARDSAPQTTVPVGIVLSAALHNHGPARKLYSASAFQSHWRWFARPTGQSPTAKPEPAPGSAPRS
jgi:hypothetical protein